MISCPNCIEDMNVGNQCPPEDSVLYYFSEIVVNGDLTIPPQKPDVEDITNVTLNFRIDDVEVIDVDLGTTTGRKVIVAGTLTLGFEYSALVPTQEVHFAHFDIPFKALIAGRPCNVNRGLLPSDFDICDYEIHICVEHAQYHVVDPRTLRKVLVVLVWLKEKP